VSIVLVAGETAKPMTACRCHCGDFPALEVCSCDGGQASLKCPCGKVVGPEPFEQLSRLVYTWNHNYRRGC
jgi:hypothetical protein